MTPAIVIAALEANSATIDQVEWACKRVRVLWEFWEVFSRLDRAQWVELRDLTRLLHIDVDWDGLPWLDDTDDLSN